MIKEYLHRLKQDFYDIRWNSIRSINSFKTTIACLIGYLIVLFGPLSQPQWIVITILVVMSAQSTFGGVLIKARMRFWGTLAGGLVAVAALLISGHDAWWVAAVLAVSTLFFSYIAGSRSDISAAGVLGGVTVAVILLSQQANVATAMERLLEIVLGIIIAFLVAKYIFPVRAHSSLLKSFSDTVDDLQKHLNRCLENDADNLTFSNIDLDEQISKAFQTQRTLIHEMAFEPGKHSRQILPFQKILNSLIKIYRFINMLYYSEHSSQASLSTIKAFGGLDVFQQRVNKFLTQIATALRSDIKDLNNASREFEQYLKNDFASMVKQNKQPDIAAINAFLFAGRLLTQQLVTLAELVNEVNTLRLK